MYARNHKNASNFPEVIEEFLKTGQRYGAVLGPFKNNPFESNITISPLNTVPKSANKRRVILNIYFPTFSE